MISRTGRLLAVSMALVLALAVPLGGAHAAAPAAQGSAATMGRLLGAGPALATLEPNSLTPVASCQAAKACPSCATGVRPAPVLPQAGLPSLGGPGTVQPDMLDPGDTSIQPTPIMNGSWVQWDGAHWTLSVYISHQDAEMLITGAIVAGIVCGAVGDVIAAILKDPDVANVLNKVCDLLASLSVATMGFLDSDRGPGFMLVADRSGVHAYS